MPVLTTPHISDSTSWLIDRAVAEFALELKPYVALIRSGRPSNSRQLASDMNVSVSSALSLYVRAIHAFCDAIRSLEIDEGERQEILRWMSQPRSEGKFLTTSQVLARLSEMDAA